MTSVCMSMTIRAEKRYETNLDLHTFFFALDLCFDVHGQGYPTGDISVDCHSRHHLIPVENHVTYQHSHMGSTSW